MDKETKAEVVECLKRTRALLRDLPNWSKTAGAIDRREGTPIEAADWTLDHDIASFGLAGAIIHVSGDFHNRTLPWSAMKIVADAIVELYPAHLSNLIKYGMPDHEEERPVWAFNGHDRTEHRHVLELLDTVYDQVVKMPIEAPARRRRAS